MASSNEMTGIGGRFVVGRAGALTCGVDVRAVREILPAGPITRIPGAVAIVLGVINVRGELVTVLDGRRALGQPASNEPGTVILLRGKDPAVGLAVDEVFDMIDVGPDAYADRERLPGVDPSLVAAVAHHEDRVVVVLDTDALLGAIVPT